MKSVFILLCLILSSSLFAKEDYVNGCLNPKTQDTLTLKDDLDQATSQQEKAILKSLHSQLKKIFQKICYMSENEYNQIQLELNNQFIKTMYDSCRYRMASLTINFGDSLNAKCVNASIKIVDRHNSNSKIKLKHAASMSEMVSATVITEMETEIKNLREELAQTKLKLEAANTSRIDDTKRDQSSNKIEGSKISVPAGSQGSVPK